MAMTEDASETEDAVSLSDLIVEFGLLNVCRSYIDWL